MRKDAVGFFWDDTPVKKERKTKEVVKRTPPDPTWLRPDYLPHLAEARAANYNLYTQDELIYAAAKQEPLIYDIECYPNYFLIAFMGIYTHKVIYFELDETRKLNHTVFSWVWRNFPIISFNGKHYDEPMANIAIAGYDNATLKGANNMIIEENYRPWEVLRQFKLRALPCNHIDIKEVMPGVGVGLKLYGARLGAQTLQDLPFPPDSFLNEDQKTIIRWYCVNDLKVTEMCYLAVKPDIELRENIGREHGIDVRSRSDAQVAEDVITAEYKALTGRYPPKPQPHELVGTILKYDVPAWMGFTTPLMQSVLQLVRDCNFKIGDDGKIINPAELKGLKFQMGNVTYSMGIGGLHSSEKNLVSAKRKGWKKKDADVTSYYPETILGQRLFPTHLGEVFLTIYKKIVDTRIAAKRAGEKRKSDSLKITINGAYGKFGSIFSFLYAPKLLLQTTLTGQLALLMLSEHLELNGAGIVSANTDGIVIEFPDHMEETVNRIVAQWEEITKFEMEYTEYESLHSSNVNNYVAIKANGEVKRKGWYREPGLTKNSNGIIILDAVVEYIKNRTPVSDTIRNCKDLNRFIVVRQARGGAVMGGTYLGGVVRWYHSNQEGLPEIIYAKNGNKVAGSTNGMPIQELPNFFPADMHYEHYIDAAQKMLEEFGY